MTEYQVRTYLRRPAALGAAVAAVTAGQGLVMVAERSEQWVGHWPSTSAVVGWAVLFGASLAAAAAAWVVAVPRRQVFADLLANAARPWSRVYGRGLLWVALGNAIGYAVVVGYVVTVTAPEATRGSFDGWEVLPTAAAVPGAVGLGAFLGRYAPAALAPVIAAVAPYAAYALATYGEAFLGTRVLTELFPMDTSSRDHLAVPVEVLVSKAVVGVSLGVALLGVVFRAPRSAGASALVGALAVGGVLLIGGVRFTLPQTYAVVCAGDAPAVCVDQPRDHLLPEYRDRVDESFAEVPGLDPSEVVVVPFRELFSRAQREVGAVPEIEADTRVVVALAKDDTVPAHEIDPARFTAEVGYGLFQRPCRHGGDLDRTDRDGGEREGRIAGLVLYEWWLASHGLPTDGSIFPGEPPVRALLGAEPVLRAAREAFRERSEAQQRQWLAAHLPDVLRCSAPLPDGTAEPSVESPGESPADPPAGHTTGSGAAAGDGAR